MWKLTRILRYPYALIRDITLGELTLRAMSLVYTTLLSIVPIIALSFSVLKGLGYHRELEPVLYSFLEPLGDRAYEITQQVMEFVDNVRGGVLGSISLIFLLYALISTVQKVEESFNFVWRVEQPRSIGRRFSEYLSVMVVGPAVIVAALGVIATIGSTSFVETLSHYRPFDTVLLVLGRITPYLLVSGVFTFMYGFVPNAKVRIPCRVDRRCRGRRGLGLQRHGDGALRLQRVDHHGHLRRFRLRHRGAHVAVHFLAHSAARRAAVVLHPEPAVPAAGTRRDRVELEHARASGAIHHVSHRQRLPDGAAPLDVESSGRTPGPAGRGAHPDHGRARVAQAVAGRGR